MSVWGGNRGRQNCDGSRAHNADRLLIRPASGRQTGTGHYDRFRGRLVFPIADSQGRVIGFGGRALAGETHSQLLLPAGAGVAFEHVPAFHLEDIAGDAGLVICTGVSSTSNTRSPAIRLDWIVFAIFVIWLT